jgi:hypothetical protein
MRMLLIPAGSVEQSATEADLDRLSSRKAAQSLLRRDMITNAPNAAVQSKPTTRHVPTAVMVSMK